MKKLIYVLAISATSFAFQACNSGTKDAKETADSLNKTKDTTSNEMATGGIAVDQSDAEFATKAAVGGMAEVELGKLALTKTSNAQLKEFANMMVNDHGKANAELMAVAKMKNITLPGMVDEEHQKKMNDLQQKSGADFDKAYTDAMVDGHKSTLDLMNKEAKDGKDADLKSFAAKTAPVVQTHLDMITKIQKTLK
ncbi:DUF4142 domain-containing protein [Pedobacter antarcticus]|uniref:Membrane protein n=2 Tax=Pedobacter antarcticus TaxID=34086 RepID=A0A081PBQ5_9SPHI|nr:DUF4142 domain-containing protein [Pedobacter antarcticus]KEQ28128.1 membrane protein [Pedobacter antarcticus 4BY]SDL42030.1 putative membrane protein [Pedobacter antarcticus]SFE42847.1 putative membrane protein [Pedobacter antarcticus]